MIDKIKDYLPLFGALTLIISGSRLVVYYQEFGIDITSYIDLSEVVTLMFDFLLYGAFFVLYLLWVYAFQLSVSKDNKENKEFLRLDKLFNEKYNRQIIGIDKISLLFASIDTFLLSIIRILPLVILAVLVLSESMYSPSHLVVLLLGIVLTIFGLKHFLILLSNTISPVKNSIFKEKLRFLAAGLIFLMLNMFNASTDARNLIHRKSNKKVTIEFRDKLVKTNNNYIYVGRTKNFTFFYNRQTKYAHAYPNDEVKRLYMRDHVQYYNPKNIGIINELKEIWGLDF